MNSDRPMPRRAEPRSIVGPLILIAAGVLWLLFSLGVIPTSNLWSVLRFWPVLLIILGVDALLRWRWPVLANLVALVTVGLALAAIIFAPRLGLSSPGGWLSLMPFGGFGPEGSGHVITETRDVADYDSIVFSSVGELTLQQGEEPGLTIEGEDNVISEIKTEVRGGTLYIEYARPDGWARVRPTQPIRLTATVVELEDLDFSGAGRVQASRLSAEQLQIDLSGAGSVSLEDLTVTDLSLQLSGAGSLGASGEAGNLEVVVSGVGSYDGADLRSDTAQVELSGLGSATVWAVDRLEATVSGLGSVDYYGQPQVSESVSGLGNVRRLGDR